MNHVQSLLLQSHDAEGLYLQKMALDELNAIRGAGGDLCSSCPPYQCYYGWTCPLYECDDVPPAEVDCKYGGPYGCYISTHC